MVLLRQSTPATEDERAFLQQRVAGFSLLGTVCFGGFLAFRVVLFNLINGFPWDGSLTWHAVGSLTFVLAWLITRGRPVSILGNRIVETVSILVGASTLDLMISYGEPTLQPHYIVLLALGAIMMGRAVYVPSSARRTLALAVAVGAALLGVVYQMYLGVDVDEWAAIAPDYRGATVGQIARDVTIYTGAWWALTVVISTAASSVIYGLRAGIRDAKRLGQYQLEQKLGEGGMGKVYRARHALLRRPTAIKLLSPETAGEAAIERFEHEVRSTARLTHPNVVTIFDYGRTPDGVFYYAMELIEGATLTEMVELTGAQPAARVIHILRQAAAALVEAHGVDLIHRDIKPANIMVRLPHRFGGVAEQALVLDFGLVKETTPAGDLGLTQTGSIIGTPQYMSPEAILTPESVDARSDLYALGAVGYYLSTGQHVFVGDNVIEVCGQHLHAAPIPPGERLGAEVPEDLEMLLLDCLAKDPNARPRSALELQTRLEACESATAWGAKDAQEWWEEYGDALRTEHQRSASVTPLTLEIDRARRGLGSSG